jgi:ABC-type transport system involved in multi-copper enzyme maturation permease subunit
MGDSSNTSGEAPVRTRLPSSLRQAGTIAKYELLNSFGSRRFFVLLAIVLLISGGMTFAVAYEGVSSFGSTPVAFYSAWYLGGVTTAYTVIFCAIAFGGDAISGEFQNKSGYFLVGNPIGRPAIYAGKYLGALVASLVLFGALTAITLANGAYYFAGKVPLQFTESFVFALVFLLTALALTFFFSSLFKNSSTSILVTSILLFFGFFILVALIGGRAHVEPWFLLTYGSDIIGNVINPAGYPAHTSVVSGSTTYAATIPEGLAIMGAYLVASAVLGFVLFKRKEFT